MILLEPDLIRMKGLLANKQKYVAGAIGVTANTLSLKLKGERRFYFDELNQIAKFLQCNTTDFLREVEY